MVGLFLVIAISLGAFGQVSLKHGMRAVDLGELGPRMALRVLQAVFTPYVLLGLSLYAVSSCFWLVVPAPTLRQARPEHACAHLSRLRLHRIWPSGLRGLRLHSGPRVSVE